MEVYILTNIYSGKRYVGQTKTSIKARMCSYRCLVRFKGRQSVSAIHGAMRKYGVDAFELKAVQTCRSQQELDHAEKMWIRALNTLVPNGYNLRDGGLGGKHHPRTKSMIKGRVLTEEWKAKISAAKKGRKLSESHKVIALAALERGRKNMPRRSGEANPRAILTFNDVQRIIERYEKGDISQSALAAQYGVAQTTISHAISGRNWATIRDLA